VIAAAAAAHTSVSLFGWQYELCVACSAPLLLLAKLNALCVWLLLVVPCLVVLCCAVLCCALQGGCRPSGSSVVLTSLL
jgi:hypothetical protein